MAKMDLIEDDLGDDRPLTKAKAPAVRTSKSGLRPTDEQADCIDKFIAGGSLSIQAGAGCGKTATLVMMSNAADGGGQYTAFNKALSDDAKGKFPSHVKVNTLHSLAYHHVVDSDYHARLEAPRMDLAVLARVLRLESVNVAKVGGHVDRLEPWRQAILVRKALERFCESADTEIGHHHFAPVPGVVPDSNTMLAAYLLPAAREYWKDVEEPDGTLPYAHCCYLKQWELDRPYIDADYVLVDEAQDLSPVLISVVQKQRHARKVWVGDSQQQIYEWRGAVNALEKIKSDKQATLSQSFRFGQEIADAANSILERIKGAELRLRGTGSSRVGVVTEPDAVLTRSNAAAVEALISSGKRVHIVGGGKDIMSFCWAAKKLIDGQTTDHFELACFKTWKEVLAYVKEGGDDLKLIVKLICQFGAAPIACAIRDMPTEDNAEVVYSTAHKAKGREWRSVRLAQDFAPKPRCTCEHLESKHDLRGCFYGGCGCKKFVAGPPSDPELRLQYVAVTRAMKELDMEALRAS